MDSEDDTPYNTLDDDDDDDIVVRRRMNVRSVINFDRRLGISYFLLLKESSPQQDNEDPYDDNDNDDERRIILSCINSQNVKTRITRMIHEQRIFGKKEKPSLHVCVRHVNADVD